MLACMHTWVKYACTPLHAGCSCSSSSEPHSVCDSLLTLRVGVHIGPANSGGQMRPAVDKCTCKPSPCMHARLDRWL